MAQDAEVRLNLKHATLPTGRNSAAITPLLAALIPRCFLNGSYGQYMSQKEERCKACYICIARAPALSVSFRIHEHMCLSLRSDDATERWQLLTLVQKFSMSSPVPCSQPTTSWIALT